MGVTRFVSEYLDNTKICFYLSYRKEKFRKMLTRSRRRQLEENGGIMVVYSSYDKEGIEPKKKRRTTTKPTVSDLKREMGMYGLPTEGKKQDLQKRLASHLQKPRDGTRIQGISFLHIFTFTTMRQSL